jgi:hypothetical protein
VCWSGPLSWIPLSWPGWAQCHLCTTWTGCPPAGGVISGLPQQQPSRLWWQQVLLLLLLLLVVVQQCIIMIM